MPPEPIEKRTDDLTGSQEAPAAVPKVDAEGEASAILDDIEHREAMRVTNGGGKSKPESGKKPAWMREPLKNFETDDKGNVILKANGRPKRVRHRPRKAQPGDKLADGSVFQADTPPQAERTSRVLNLPGAGPDANVHEAGPDKSGEVGPELAEFIVDGVGDMAASLHEAAKPTDAESKVLKKGAAGTFGSARVPWWLVFAGGLILYAVGAFGRIKQANKADEKKTDKGEADHGARADSGADRDGKDAAYQGGGSYNW
jgi:hypothetical protein